MEAKKSFVFRPFRLDLGKERLWQENHEIRLTPKAFGILAYLVEHADQLVTKESLLDTLWPGVHVTESALTVCITELRKALGDDPKEPKFIQTVHRRGYRFIAPVTIGAEQVPTQHSEPTAESLPLGDSPASEPSISNIELSQENASASSARAIPGMAMVTRVWGKPVLITAAVLLVGVGVLVWNFYRYSPPRAQSRNLASRPAMVHTRKTIHCRAALRQHDRRPGTGLFQRRNLRRHHHPPRPDP
ncbi:MAG: transcriptional regulator [Candidatus Binatia bacterium]